MMRLELGVKSDPIEYRYPFDWLFALMREHDVHFLQLGSFFELFSVEDAYLTELRALADLYNIRIKSVFTAHRELGGFFTGNPHLERAARRNWERLIDVASLVGADFVGSNPGAVYRNHLADKERGLASYVRHMKELSQKAKVKGLKALTLEPMSCLAEPPSTPDEIRSLLTELSSYHQANQATTVPFYLCGDVSHGVADKDKKILHDNMELFEFGLPWMCEFHFKNTDSIFNSTFGFGPEERARGIVDVGPVVSIARRRAADWPVEEVVGYLEIGGPKHGRDYSDNLLGQQLSDSLEHIKTEMGK
jgi:ribulose-phosphate 3-epimerase